MIKLKVYINFEEEIISDSKDNFIISDFNKKMFPWKINSKVKISSFQELDHLKKVYDTEFVYDIFDGIRNCVIDWLILNLDETLYENYKEILKPNNYIYLIDKSDNHNVFSLKINKVEIVNN
jgi:hypothetical protein